MGDNFPLILLNVFIVLFTGQMDRTAKRADT